MQARAHWSPSRRNGGNRHVSSMHLVVRHACCRCAVGRRICGVRCDSARRTTSRDSVRPGRRDAGNQIGAQHGRPSNRDSGRVADGAHRAAREGEGADAREGRPRCRAPAVTDGEGREVLRVRHARRPAHACRALRGPEPACHLSLHVRAGVDRRVPELLVALRSPRSEHRAPRAARRHGGRRVARDAAGDQPLQAADGMAVHLGVIERVRLQSRLPCLVHAR